MFDTNVLCSSRQRAVIIINRLINLLENIMSEHHASLKTMLSEWAAKDFLDSDIVDIFWQYFMMTIDVSDDHARAALHLAGLAGAGRRSIIETKVRLISDIGFGMRAQDDLLLVRETCDVLILLGVEGDKPEEVPRLVISAEDPMWSNLFDILYDNFQKPAKFVNNAICSGMHVLFQVGIPSQHCVPNVLNFCFCSSAQNRKELQRIS